MSCRSALALIALVAGVTAGASAQAGTPVTFTFHDSEGGSREVRVLAPVVLSRGPMLAYPPAAVAGNRRFVVIGCRYANVAGEPTSVTAMNAMIGTPYPGWGIISRRSRTGSSVCPGAP